MRRKDREISDPEKIERTVKSCICCRIGFYDDGEVYIVPLNFGYEKLDGVYTLYFHGAKEGRKMELIQRNPKVGFEMDSGYALRCGERACDCTAAFQSVIGNGHVSMVTSSDEKKYGLRLIMEHNTGKTDWDFDTKMLDAVAVFKLVVSNFSCKEHE